MSTETLDSMFGIFWFFAFLANISTAFFAADVGAKKGHGGCLLFLLGLIFGLLGLIYAVGLPDSHRLKKDREWQEWYHNDLMAQLRRMEARPETGDTSIPKP